jgi:hypothetical protein
MSIQKKPWKWVRSGATMMIEPCGLLCPFCNKVAIVALPTVERDRVKDGTSHVCHPTFGGCGQAWAQEADSEFLISTGCGSVRVLN